MQADIPLKYEMIEKNRPLQLFMSGVVLITSTQREKTGSTDKIFITMEI